MNNWYNKFHKISQQNWMQNIQEQSSVDGNIGQEEELSEIHSKSYKMKKNAAAFEIAGAVFLITNILIALKYSVTDSIDPETLNRIDDQAEKEKIARNKIQIFDKLSKQLFNLVHSLNMLIDDDSNVREQIMEYAKIAKSTSIDYENLVLDGKSLPTETHRKEDSLKNVMPNMLDRLKNKLEEFHAKGDEVAGKALSQIPQ